MRRQWIFKMTCLNENIFTIIYTVLLKTYGIELLINNLNILQIAVQNHNICLSPSKRSH